MKYSGAHRVLEPLDVMIFSVLRRASILNGLRDFACIKENKDKKYIIKKV
jgi:hypothetical protein